MNNAESKFILFLSDSSLSDREFRDIMRLMDSGRAHRSMMAAKHLRDTRRQVLSDFTSSDIDDEVYRRTRELLVEDLGMPSGKALMALAIELGEDPDIIQSSKLSFREGLKRLSIDQDGSTVLSAAQRVANRFRDPSKRHDWGLTGGTDK